MSERKFTDEEIIAVVKRCVSPVNECEGCPFEGVHRGDRECFNVATDELIEIASRQKKELAALKPSEWISVEDRLPTAEENDRGIVGIVNGYNGKIGFINAIIFVDYDFEERKWWPEDYDIPNCKVEYWMPLPEPPKMKGGAEQ